MDAKPCCRCRETQRLEDFPRNKFTSDGRDYKCKACHRAAWHERKPPLVFIAEPLPPGFILSGSNIREVLDLGADGLFRWARNIHPKAPKGHITGDRSRGDYQRIFIGKQRFRGDHLKVLWETGEWPNPDQKPIRNKVYEEEWMREIRSHRAFPDWGSIWKTELYERFKEKSRKEWHALSTQQKRDREARRDKVKKRAYRREWKKKAKECPIYRMKEAMSSRLSNLLRDHIEKGSKSTMRIIGCSMADLAAHIQKQFKRGMTWKNYGSYWHVDHILPVASFDHSKPEQVKQCWHWTNLQPLGAVENMSKGAKITKPQMSLCL